MRRLFLFAAAAGSILASAACGDDAAQTTGGGGATASSSSGDEGGHGGKGQGGSDDPCAPDAHTGPGGTCVVDLEAWQVAPSLAIARDHHVTYVLDGPAGPQLYVSGGVNALNAPLTSTEMSPIAADGSLAGFAPAAPLPKGVIGPGLAQVGNGVVVAGGLANTGSVADAFVGTLDGSGALKFATGPSMNVDRYHVALAADRGYVYAIGGLRQTASSQTVSADVERATFDGATLGAWEALDDLDQPLTHHAPVVYEHGLYLVGGIHGSTTITDIVRADVVEDGTLGAFTKVGDLPAPRGTAAAFAYRDQLYVVAGAQGVDSDEKATVWRADLKADGTVGAFEDLPDLPKPRAHTHQAPLFQGVVYSAAGIANNGFQNDVYFAHLR